MMANIHINISCLLLQSTIDHGVIFLRRLTVVLARLSKMLRPYDAHDCFNSRNADRFLAS